ncbi:MAG: V-type ATPase subunit [Oscillospiraceae bacterium]
MLETFSSNVILAKTRAMYGKRLNTENYNELSRLKSVSDVVTYLKNNTYYSYYLKGINETATHRAQLEELLKRSLFSRYSKLSKYDFSENRFYSYIAIDLEIEIIMHCISLVNSQNFSEIIKVIPGFFSKYATFDIMRLIGIKSIAEFSECLNGTPYKKIIKPFINATGTIDYSDCEVALKTYYYKDLLCKIQKNFKGEVKNELLKIVKIQADALNLSKIFRLKFYFKVDNEKIKKRLLPFYYKFSPRFLDKVLEAESTEEFVKVISLNSINGKMSSVEYNYIEDYTKRLMYILNKKFLRFSTNSAVAYFSYMALSRIEIENLIIIIEGTRYNLPSQEIKKLLILE